MLQTKIKNTEVKVGQMVKVKYNIVEGGKTRIQTFEGIIISIKGRAENKTFTVRRIGDRGVGVERIWPVEANTIVDVEVVREPNRVRRAKLYYLRNIIGRMATRV